jgi:hypothetical protein
MKEINTRNQMFMRKKEWAAMPRDAQDKALLKWLIVEKIDSAQLWELEFVHAFLRSTGVRK